MLAALSGVLTGLFLDSAKRKALAAAYFAAAAFFLVFATAYALFALREWIRLNYAPNYPDPWIAAGLVVVALPFVVLGLLKRNEASKSQAYRAAAVIAAPAVARMAYRAASPTLIAVGAIATLGLLIGRQVGRS